MPQIKQEKNRKRNSPLLSFFLIGFLIFACEQREVPKKVSLDRREKTNNYFQPSPEKPSWKFGFDLRLGPKDDVRIYQPFLKYLEQSVGEKFSLKFSEKYEDTVQNLGRGITHFAAVGPVNAVLAQNLYGAKCLVMGLNSYGKPEYRAAIIVAMTSPRQKIKELKGKTFAFGSRYSTQGHIIPRQMLAAAGIALKDFKNFVFAESHADVARLVVRGKFEAGALQDTLAQKLAAERKVKILAYSKPFPSSLIRYTKDLDRKLVLRVKEAPLSFDPAGKHVSQLKDWERTEMPKGFTVYQEGVLAEVEKLCYAYDLLR